MPAVPAARAAAVAVAGLSVDGHRFLVRDYGSLQLACFPQGHGEVIQCYGLVVPFISLPVDGHRFLVCGNRLRNPARLP